MEAEYLDPYGDPFSPPVPAAWTLWVDTAPDVRAVGLPYGLDTIEFPDRTMSLSMRARVLEDILNYPGIPFPSGLPTGVPDPEQSSVVCASAEEAYLVVSPQQVGGLFWAPLCGQTIDLKHAAEIGGLAVLERRIGIGHHMKVKVEDRACRHAEQSDCRAKDQKQPYHVSHPPPRHADAGIRWRAPSGRPAPG